MNADTPNALDYATPGLRQSPGVGQHLRTWLPFYYCGIALAAWAYSGYLAFVVGVPSPGFRAAGPHPPPYQWSVALSQSAWVPLVLIAAGVLLSLLRADAGDGRHALRAAPARMLLALVVGLALLRIAADVHVTWVAPTRLVANPPPRGIRVWSGGDALRDIGLCVALIAPLVVAALLDRRHARLTAAAQGPPAA